jgi:hypothetical protein
MDAQSIDGSVTENVLSLPSDELSRMPLFLGKHVVRR